MSMTLASIAETRRKSRYAMGKLASLSFGTKILKVPPKKCSQSWLEIPLFSSVSRWWSFTAKKALYWKPFFVFLSHHFLRGLCLLNFGRFFPCFFSASLERPVPKKKQPLSHQQGRQWSFATSVPSMKAMVNEHGQFCKMALVKGKKHTGNCPKANNYVWCILASLTNQRQIIMSDEPNIEKSGYVTCQFRCGSRISFNMSEFHLFPYPKKKKKSDLQLVISMGKC